MGQVSNNYRGRTALARSLRLNQTDAEKTLWAKLRRKQCDGASFRRQQPLGPFIVDFVCFQRKIVIEVDGGQHDFEEYRRRDSSRTAYLESRGFRVLRFWDNEVLANIEGVVATILNALG